MWFWIIIVSAAADTIEYARYECGMLNVEFWIEIEFGDDEGGGCPPFSLLFKIY